MRPRKRVFISGATDLAASVLKVVLESKLRYRVELLDRYRISPIAPPDVLLLVGRNWVRVPWPTAIVLVPARGMEPEAVWIANILASLREATTLSRGPKPRFHGERFVPREEG